MALVDQSRFERVSGEIGTTDEDFMPGRHFHLSNCFGIEVSLNPRFF